MSESQDSFREMHVGLSEVCPGKFLLDVDFPFVGETFSHTGKKFIPGLVGDNWSHIAPSTFPWQTVPKGRES